MANTVEQAVTKTDQDLVGTTLRTEGANEGQPGMLKPSDLSRLDQFLPGETGPPAAESAEATEAAIASEERVELSPEALKAIEDKVTAGAVLSEDEQAILEQMKPPAPVTTVEGAAEAGKEGAAAQPAKVYRIGKKVLTAEQVEAEARASLKIGGVDLSEEATGLLIDTYVKAQNKTEASRAIDRGQKDNATERARLESERTRLASERSRQEQFGRTLATEIRSIAERRAALQQVAARGIKKEDFLDADNRITDWEKQMAYMDQQRAIQDLQSVAARESSLATEASRNDVELARVTVEEFQAAHPEYRTKESMTVVARKITNHEAVDQEDETKVLELIDFFDIAAEKGVPMEKIWHLRTTQDHVAVKPVAQAQEAVADLHLPALPKPNQDMLKIIQDYKKRLSAGAGGPAGGSGGPAGVSRGKMSQAEALIRQSQELAGDNKGDPFLKDVLKY